jgi:hypothetical protein
MRVHQTVSRIRMPSEITLSPHVLSGAIRKLRTEDIQKVVDDLIDELNFRDGDPDFEREPAELSVS